MHGSQSCDIAVTSNGTVYVSWRQFAFGEPGQQQRTPSLSRESTDGGASFDEAGDRAVTFTHSDIVDEASSADANGSALEACLAAT